MNTQVLVRREVSRLGSADRTLADYGRAVHVMKQRADTDPTSWAFQAAIHGTQVSPVPKGQAQCQHATWYFVSWHRMYVYFFERIVRAAVVEAGGADGWTLPYWNYELGASHAKLPAAFRQQAISGAPNPLYVSDRSPAVNAGHALPAAAVTSRFAESRPHFTGAQEFGGGITPARWQVFSGPTGRLEQTPHNDVHVSVGGWMSDPDTAAQDPIFWLHHANIDRLWMAWVTNGHQNPTDTHWTGQAYSFFDEHGQPVTMTAADVLDTVTDLGYTYDQFQGLPPGPPAPAPHAVSPPSPPTPELVGASTEPVRLAGDTERVTVPLDARARATALDALSTSAPRILLQLHEVTADATPEVVYGVYINLPEDPSPAQLPLHHVGNLSFFGVRRAGNPSGDEPAHGLSLTFDITEVAATERGSGHWSDDALDVTFMPLSPVAPDDAPAVDHPPARLPAVVGAVSVFYTT